MIAEDVGFAYALLSDLHQLGVRIAIDDFASGLFSLHNMSRLPVDEININRKFIENIDQDADQWEIVDAIVGIASSFGCDIVVEGVERESQLQSLKNTSCSRVQSFVFSQDVPSKNIDRLIQHQVDIKALFSDAPG